MFMKCIRYTEERIVNVFKGLERFCRRDDIISRLFGIKGKVI